MFIAPPTGVKRMPWSYQDETVATTSARDARMGRGWPMLNASEEDASTRRVAMSRRAIFLAASVVVQS